jgi:hypothetical protein
MRKVDKLKQIEKANILAEQRFMESKIRVNEEDYSDGDADDAAFQDYYKSIVGEDEGQFFAHFNTKKEALTAILGMVNKNDGSYYKPYILSGVILSILGRLTK